MSPTSKSDWPPFTRTVEMQKRRLEPLFKRIYSNSLKEIFEKGAHAKVDNELRRCGIMR